MSKAPRSGNTVNPADVPVIKGMIGKGDRKHDVAAWYGLNQGRIAEVEDGKHGSPLAAPSSSLPPEGSSGPRAKVLRGQMESLRKLIQEGKNDQAILIIDKAIKDFDTPV